MSSSGTEIEATDGEVEVPVIRAAPRSEVAESIQTTVNRPPPNATSGANWWPLTAPEMLKAVVPKLRSGGLLVADNLTSHASELAAYVTAVQTHPQLFAVTVPIGNGEQIATKL